MRSNYSRGGVTCLGGGAVTRCCGRGRELTPVRGCGFWSCGRKLGRGQSCLDGRDRRRKSVSGLVDERKMGRITTGRQKDLLGWWGSQGCCGQGWELTRGAWCWDCWRWQRPDLHCSREPDIRRWSASGWQQREREDRGALGQAGGDLRVEVPSGRSRSGQAGTEYCGRVGDGRSEA